MLELQRIDFGTIAVKVRRVECGGNEEMSQIKGETMSQLLEIDTILEEKFNQETSNVDQIKSKINALNDKVTENINHLKDLNEQNPSLGHKTSKKNSSGSAPSSQGIARNRQPFPGRPFASCRNKAEIDKELSKTTQCGKAPTYWLPKLKELKHLLSINWYTK